MQSPHSPGQSQKLCNLHLGACTAQPTVDSAHDEPFVLVSQSCEQQVIDIMIKVRCGVPKEVFSRRRRGRFLRALNCQASTAMPRLSRDWHIVREINTCHNRASIECKKHILISPHESLRSALLRVYAPWIDRKGGKKKSRHRCPRTNKMSPQVRGMSHKDYRAPPRNI